MTPKKIISPRIPAMLETEGPEVISDEGFLSQHQLIDYHYPYQTADQVCFQQSLFQKVSFANSRFTRFECSDVIFENCDLSNIEWIEAAFHRVQFKNCKLIGANFADSVLHDCVFEDCIGKYSSFSYSKMKSVSFRQTPLLEAEFFEMSWQQLQLLECELTGSNWFNTKLAGLNFSSCPFEHISLSQELLRGLMVNQEQAITIAMVLGLIIED